MKNGDSISVENFIPSDDPLFDWPEPLYGDIDYDYGIMDDGRPIPPPCFVCGAWAATCTHDYSNQTDTIE